MQGLSRQAIQVCICCRGKKALSVKLVVQYAHNGNQGSRNQDPKHAEGGHT